MLLQRGCCSHDLGSRYCASLPCGLLDAKAPRPHGTQEGASSKHPYCTLPVLQSPHGILRRQRSLNIGVIGASASLECC